MQTSRTLERNLIDAGLSSLPRRTPPERNRTRERTRAPGCCDLYRLSSAFIILHSYPGPGSVCYGFSWERERGPNEGFPGVDEEERGAVREACAAWLGVSRDVRSCAWIRNDDKALIMECSK